MKKCPNCNQTYSDETLNFCLADGATLFEVNDEPPPTIFMDQARVTSPTNLAGGNPFSTPGSEPLSPWQNQQMSPQNPAYMAGSAFQTQDKTLPTISLVLGIIAVVFFCCYGGILFGIPAMIVGFFGFNNTNKNPSQYGGRGMAIAGMALGAVSLAGVFLLLFFGILGNI
jgi:hypothetical protein